MHTRRSADTGVPAQTHAGPFASVLAHGQHVQLVLFAIQLAEVEPETHTADGGQDGDEAVVPHQQRVGGEGHQGLGDGGAEGVHEQVDGHDKGAHVGRGLCEGVFETGDAGHDLGEADEDVRECLHPDVDRGRAGAVWVGGVRAAWGKTVDLKMRKTGAMLA